MEEASDLQGRAVLEAIRGTADVDEEYGTIVYAQRRERAEGQNQFRRIIQKDLRPHLIMSIALPFFQQVSWQRCSGLQYRFEKLFTF